ncbi:MAG: hypothetical protein ACYS8I_02595 [Planctomycetota bacterium]|jgi:hypothetical protein
MIRKGTLLLLTLCLLTQAATHSQDKTADKPDHPHVPGAVIDYLPSRLKDYVGSPSIAILPNGRYVASHDVFGDGPGGKGTHIFESADSGRTWKLLAQLAGQYWSTLFVHRGQLYIIGTSRKQGDIVIRRSTDGGKWWTKPKDKSSGLLAKGRFHCAPVPVVVHKGRIWRAFEVAGGHYRWEAFVMSAPADADLLNADNWLMSKKLMLDKRADIFKWLEGNVLVTPEGGLVNMLRTQAPPARAAMIHISADGTQLGFDPDKDMIAFPGGAKKFTIRYDKVTGKYWSLVNIITDPGPMEEPPQDHRNTLALTCSKDLRNWEVRYVALSFRRGEHLTRKNNKFGFQYIDWLIEGNDIIFVSRTAWGWDTPRSHDANYLTFHRIKNFRNRRPGDRQITPDPWSPSDFGTAGLERIKYNNPELVADLGVGLWAWPLPMDYDNDGDYDLVVSCSDKPYNGTYFFENPNGDVKMPIFKPAVRLGRGYKHAQVSYVDGKHRVLIPAKELVSFRSAGTDFEKTAEIYPTDRIHKAKGRIRARQWKYYDYDGDGDLDLIAGIADWTEYGWDNAFNSEGKWTNGPLHGYVYLILNNGTTDKPVYAEPVQISAGREPIDVYGMPSPNLEDFDSDGDLDIICGEFVDKFTYFENIGTRAQPEYAKGRYLMNRGQTLKMDLCMITPVALDWDKDGDIDLIVGEEDGRVSLVEHTGKVVNGLPQFLPPVFFKQEAQDVKFGALVTPYSFDWDADGDEDLICGNTAGYIGFIENLDGGCPPKWAPPKYLQADGKVIRIQAGYNGSIQGPCEAKWGYTTLSVADWNHDSLPDIVINSIWGKVLWFRNIGTRKNPKLAAAKPIEVQWPGKPPKPAWTWWEPQGKQLATQWRTTPVVIDLNNDGLNDLVMLDHKGYLAFFERNRENGRLKLLPANRIFKNKKGEMLRLSKRNAGGSGRRKLCFADWDCDGKIDLLLNHHNVLFYRNVSDSSDSYTFEEVGPVDDRILAGHSTSPTTVDWDRNGIRDLLVGAEDGFLYYMRNPHAPGADIQPANF